MAQADQRPNGSDSAPFTLPSFIPKLFPFLKPKSPAANDTTVPKTTVVVSADEGPQNSTRTVVSFPNKPPKNAETLNVEVEPSSGRTTNSLILWQVYALGGFLVLKWAWARWNERNERKDKKEGEDDDDDQPPSGHED